jgi:uncharacterized SAM-binding protein YcdF (DUF218 family)
MKIFIGVFFVRQSFAKYLIVKDMIVSILRYFSALSEPIGLFWLLLIFLGGYKILRRRWDAGLSLLFMAGLLWCISTPMFVKPLLAEMEKKYANKSIEQLPNCDAVVVLGSGFFPSDFDVCGAGLNESADRIFSGIDLIYKGKARYLIIGGGVHERDGVKIAYGEFIERWLQNFKLIRMPVLNVGPARNTYEEALATKVLMQKYKLQSLYLVTSAYHMDRAVAVFKHAGLQVVPFASDFQCYGVQTPNFRCEYIPQRKYLEYLEYYLHEKFGLLLYTIKGWQVPENPSLEKLLQNELSNSSTNTL